MSKISSRRFPCLLESHPLQALTVFCLFGGSRRPRSRAISNVSFRRFPLVDPTAINPSIPFSIKFERIISFLLCRQALNCRHDFCAFSLPNMFSISNFLKFVLFIPLTQINICNAFGNVHADIEKWSWLADRKWRNWSFAHAIQSKWQWLRVFLITLKTFLQKTDLGKIKSVADSSLKIH